MVSMDRFIVVETIIIAILIVMVVIVAQSTVIYEDGSFTLFNGAFSTCLPFAPCSL